MGRRKRRSGHGLSKAKGDGEEEGTEDIDPHAEGFYRDEVDKFHAQSEKILLERSGNLEPASSSDNEELSDEEEEVLGLQLSDHDSEDGEGEGEESGDEFELPPELRKFYASDDEGEDSEGHQFPGLSAKAWGRSKKAFYSTDYVDYELGGATDEEEAELEEQEALVLQQRMAAELDEGDFELGPLLGAEGEEKRTEKGTEERVIQDLSKLSREDKLALLEKDSPELFELLEEFEEKFSEALSLRPLVMTARKEPSFLTAQGQEYLEAKFHLYLCYCLNIMFYLRLKACKTPVQNHPVIGRIVQIRQLISRLEPVDKKLESQMTALLVSLKSELAENDDSEEPSSSREGGTRLEQAEENRKRRKTQVSAPAAKKHKKHSTEKNREPPGRESEDEKAEKRDDSVRDALDPLAYYEQVKAEKQLLKRARKEAAEKREERRGREGAGASGEMEEEEDGKRAITYQIARNKGLTVKRKKEQRNPRVRHRKKFQKALIKRKSQVLPVVPELDRYGGERTGIRANLSRSVKIK